MDARDLPRRVAPRPDTARTVAPGRASMGLAREPALTVRSRRRGASTRPQDDGFGTFVTVVHQHGCSWHRSPRAVSTALLATWTGRLALLVAALGLVLMHHVVGAHQHTTTDTGAVAAGHATVGTGGTSASSVEHGAGADRHPPTAHDAIGHATAMVPGPESASSAALLHDHAHEGDHDHDSSLLHMCLAALIGAAALLALVLVTSWYHFESQAPVGGRGAAATVPRAPPTPTRLAQLQVLRL